MDGTWTFRCRKCDSAFEVVASEEEHAGDLAKDKRCPSCGLVPSDPAAAESIRGERWHKVIGFRGSQNTARRFVF